MKKLLGLVAIAIVVALLCSPMLLGRQAQGHIEQVVQNLNDYPGYQASIKSYQRSWMTSYAEVEVGIDMGQFANTELDDMPPLSFTLLLALDHGPVLLNDGFDIGLYAWRAGPASETLAKVHETLGLEGDEPFYRMWGKTSLSGTTHFQDKARAFAIQTPELNADFAGYGGEGEISRAGQLTYQGEMAQVSVTDGTTSASIEGFETEVEADLAHLDWSTLVYPADLEMKIAQAQFRSPFGGGASLDSMRIASKVTLSDDGGAFDVTSEFSVDEILGDMGAATDLKLVMSVVNLDLEAYRAYLDAYSEVMQAATADANNSAPMPDFSQMFDQQLMQKFVARGPEIRLDKLAFTLPQGSLQADFAMTFDKDSQVPAQEMIMFWLMSAVSVNANAELDRPLAEFFAQLGAAAQGMVPEDGSDPGVAMLDMMIAQGVLIESDGKVSTEMEMANGTLSVNGEPFPLGAMMP